ncbi:DNA-binding response regulator [Anabaena cylindrica FACHB-243]|uniref:Two component transcriptional regulator, AraC family n=1 Tax=Anabaena cylindrica (strain ATCC 27899 / PCC 7122) TaxID=272123 RepID=K9ZC74_ANACC|nr:MULTISPECIES: DNA-binding response regulator [Anabaena]AFZ56823.1 two component transcriptional regulator, AraC family [Anabaena cylindrica PCC 7122]MBD2418967.1 DNA-binding response regulator [Anabaena cylindrica FACHB-243]MBY5285109.1 response regulator transcription factor [Anabaena sp. CCAP 1446/1C]MBY5308841.1 response regulator transcription factor [Anabaena sp. CCAP 1446/1C]MCM2409500.1 DNA-binding response regulator [Anabaena sp. CCAP 1446/1C]
MNTILVIEDETTTRNLFMNYLKSQGFSTVGAENGIEGIQRTRECLPDLVLCDILMPGIDGYDVLSTLRQDPLTAIVPVIFLTVTLSKAELRKGMNLGADDYLTKPCTLEELSAAITAQLNKQTVLKQWYLNQRSPVTSESTDTTNFYPHSSRLSKVFQYIEENYHKQINLSDVAQAAGYSHAYLTHLVKRQTQRSVRDWIVERRMTEARFLLLNTDKTVNQIANKVGYPDAGYFIRLFRQIHQLPPKEWRNTSRIQPVIPYIPALSSLN